MRTSLRPLLYFSSLALMFLCSATSASTPTISALGYRVIDAEFSKSLNKIVSVSANPSRLHVYDPIGLTDIPVNLPLAPSSVSVSPDGLYAAVGHNAYVSYIDLSKGTLLKTIPVTTDVLDVVLAGNGYIYAFPRADQWVEIHSINVATKVETLSSGYSIRAGTLAKLHPNGKAIYGADNGLSPSDIAKYGIESGTAKVLYDSPYHGDYAMCGNLWISEDGNRIFTRCGNVFRASDVHSEDMTYNGKLSATNYIQHLSHSKKAGKVLAISAATDWPTAQPNADTKVQIYGYQYLNLISTKALPNFVVNSKPFAAHGRFVFYSSDASKFFVVVQADNASGLLKDYGVVTFETTIAPCDPLSGNADCDYDGILNKDDNCILAPNDPDLGGNSQLDSDADKYGNICDADLTNDAFVDTADFTAWLDNADPQQSPWLSTCKDARYQQAGDFNGDCKIDALDSDIFMKQLFKKPGPSCIDLPVAQKGKNC